MGEINSFLNKNSVLTNGGDIFKNKSWLGKSGKIISLFKQEADAILNKEQVLDGYYYSKKEGVVKLDKYLVREKASEYADTQGFLDEKDGKIFGNQRVLFISQQVANNNSFSYISEKFKMINKNIDNILFGIANNGFISKSSVYFSLLHVYLNNYYISINDIEKRLFNYFEKIANKAYNRAKSPLIASYDYGYKEVVQEYHDLEHDLGEEEKQILVYCMVNNLLGEEKKHELEKILKKGGDSLDYFYNSYYREDLLGKYVNKLISI